MSGGAHCAKHAQCAAFLQWALPRIGLRWEGYRRVRGVVCKRLARRLRELGVPDASAYRRHLEAHGDEWRALAALCAIPISRFYRDKAVFDCLGSEVLPALAKEALGQGREQLECWSAGCASGEEPYTVAIQWRMLLAPGFPRLGLRVLGTDIDGGLLERAAAACYKASSLAALPLAWRAQAFERRGDVFCLRESWRREVGLECRDLLGPPPQRQFDLVLCRNLAFTYFGAEQARTALDRIASRLRRGGALVIGTHEKLPIGAKGFEPWRACRAIYRLQDGGQER